MTSDTINNLWVSAASCLNSSCTFSFKGPGLFSERYCALAPRLARLTNHRNHVVTSVGSGLLHDLDCDWPLIGVYSFSCTLSCIGLRSEIYHWWIFDTDCQHFGVEGIHIAVSGTPPPFIYVSSHAGWWFIYLRDCDHWVFLINMNSQFSIEFRIV